MGSCSMGSRIGEFVDTFASAFETYFTHLVGLTIVSLADVTVDYHVKGSVKLSNEEVYPVHYRWSTEEEDNEGAELHDDAVLMDDYYEANLIGRMITKVELGESTDMSEELFLLAFVDERHCLEIPVGYDPEHHTVDPVTLEIIGRDAWKAFGGILDDEPETK